MPTNLNALIRYKQIDKELKNPYVKTTIRSLQEACSKQLEEFRGIYKLVSERTIRDDIRVMRSGALGYFAPIVVEDGVYSYSEKDFSIYKEEIHGGFLLKEITELLLEERDNIKSDKLEGVLKELSKLTGINTASPKPKEELRKELFYNISDKLISKKINIEEIGRTPISRDVSCSIDEDAFDQDEIVSLGLLPPSLNWKDVLELF